MPYRRKDPPTNYEPPASHDLTISILYDDRLGMWTADFQQPGDRRRIGALTLRDLMKRLQMVTEGADEETIP